jgi:hypothetical protein
LHDSLTGLPNRESFLRTGQAALAFAMLMRLATLGGARNTSFRLVTGSIGMMLAADGPFAAGDFVPAIGDNRHSAAHPRAGQQQRGTPARSPREFDTEWIPSR